MVQLLEKVVPVWVNYTTPEGHTAVRARAWHPAWFIPYWRLKLREVFYYPKRYREYRRALQEISREAYSGQCSRERVIDILRNIQCGYECDFVEPYGFVPEAGCP